MYVTKPNKVLLQRKAIYEDRLLQLDKRHDSGEITGTDYEHLKAVYELILRELILIDKTINNKN